MQKKVAIITGASRGIGRAVALDLAKQGYILVLIARTAEKLKEVADIIKKSGGLCDAYPTDISNFTQIDQIMDSIISKHERVDVLFNNAGIIHRGSENLTHEQINSVIDINLKGAIYITNKVIPVMKQQKSGYIINLSSRSGVEGSPGSSVYSASKFGLVGYSESLFHGLMQDGIKVTAICPDYVNTDMPQWISAEKKGLLIPQEEIVRAINYLLQSARQTAIKEMVIYCTDCLCGNLPR